MNQQKTPIYGAEQPTAPTAPTTGQRQFRGFRKLIEQFDVVKMNTDGTLTVRAIDASALRQTTASQVDLATQLNNFTIVFQETIPSIGIGDYIFPNTGATEGDTPTDLPAGTKYQVAGLQEAGNRYRQILFGRHIFESNKMPKLMRCDL